MTLIKVENITKFIVLFFPSSLPCKSLIFVQWTDLLQGRTAVTACQQCCIITDVLYRQMSMWNHIWSTGGHIVCRETGNSLSKDWILIWCSFIRCLPDIVLLFLFWMDKGKANHKQYQPKRNAPLTIHLLGDFTIIVHLQPQRISYVTSLENIFSSNEAADIVAS